MSEQKKKNNVVVLVIIIVLVLVIGGYAVWQTKDKTKSTSSENTVTTTTTQVTTTTENQVVEFINKEVALKVGDTNTLLVNAPENATLNWSSSDTSVVTVENGNIKGVAKGTAVITVQLGNSTDNCTVTVKEKKKKKATVKTSVTVIYKNSSGDSYWLNSNLISNMGGDTYLASFSDWDIQRMINEILARNHYKFKTNEWFSYFSSCDWYYYDTSDMSVVESRFNSIERDNYNYLANYRNRH